MGRYIGIWKLSLCYSRPIVLEYCGIGLLHWLKKSTNNVIYLQWRRQDSRIGGTSDCSRIWQVVGGGGALGRKFLSMGQLFLARYVVVSIGHVPPGPSCGAATAWGHFDIFGPKFMASKKGRHLKCFEAMTSGVRFLWSNTAPPPTTHRFGTDLTTGPYSNRIPWLRQCQLAENKLHFVV